LVLMALQQIPLEGKAVLDIGCGSGVLAIAAIKLGARLGTGIDIDADALGNARENAALNGLVDRLRFEEADFRHSPIVADVVLANLTGGLLARSAEALAATVAPHGRLIVSGFMVSEKDDVIAALETYFALQSLTQEEEWMALLGGRR